MSFPNDESAQMSDELRPGEDAAREASEEEPRLPLALVVDDDALVCRILAEGLGEDFEVVTARDPREALDRLGDARYRLIVADHFLGEVTGIDLLERTLRVRPDAVRMLITASESVGVAMEAVNRAQVDRYYVKPVPVEELRAEAVAAVRQRDMEDDLEARLENLRSRMPQAQPRLLVVDDEETALEVYRAVLEDEGYEIVFETSAAGAMDRLGAREFDLLLADKNLPDGSGLDVMRVARQLHPELEAVLITAYPSTDTAIEAMEAGAYDYLRKPLEDITMLPRVIRRALQQQGLARDRQRLLLDLFEVNRVLSTTNDSLLGAQARLGRQVEEMELLQDATVMGLTRLAEYRDLETGEHLERMRSYARLIAEELRGQPGFECIDDAYVQAIYRSAPLHDIGKVGIPDRILCKPGKLTPDEWEVMRTHPTIGGQTLEEAERRAGPESATNLLRMGKNIAYFHHERWDGAGYPFGRSGEEIPLEARIVTVADAYDAITSRRVYKPSLPHAYATEVLIGARGTHFDPASVDAFLRREEDILRIREAHGSDELET